MSATTPSRAAETAALNRYMARVKARTSSFVDPSVIRAMVTGASVPTFGHGISTLYIRRFVLTALVPEPRLENAGDADTLPQFEVMSGDQDHRVISGFGAKQVVYLQPGHALAALQVAYGIWGVHAIDAMNGIDDPGVYDEVQEAILPGGVLRDANGDEIVTGLHHQLDKLFRAKARDARAAGKDMIAAAADTFALANTTAYRTKVSKLTLLQHEILLTKSGASGRTVANYVEATWAQECGFALDSSIRVISGGDAIDAYIPPQPDAPAPPINITIDESFFKRAAEAKGGVSEARLIELLAQSKKDAFEEAVRYVTTQFRNSPEYLEQLRRKVNPERSDAPFEEVIGATELEGAGDADLYVGEDTVIHEREEPRLEFVDDDGETTAVTEFNEATASHVEPLLTGSVAEEHADEAFEVPDDDHPNPLGEIDPVATGGLDLAQFEKESYGLKNAAEFKNVEPRKPGSQIRRANLKGKKK